MTTTSRVPIICKWCEMCDSVALTSGEFCPDCAAAIIELIHRETIGREYAMDRVAEEVGMPA